STDGKAAGTTAAVRVVARALGIAPLRDWQVRLPAPAGNDAYDVRRDSAALKADLSAFEHLRETYPVRREL
ncbi:MAG: erythronate-4-phosphate dehydrogenase, partial [Bacteroidales bacterium]|nr:erythronate-4-phosphate dehydrogenase [Bacteroidales bacterium]